MNGEILIALTKLVGNRTPHHLQPPLDIAAVGDVFTPQNPDSVAQVWSASLPPGHLSAQGASSKQMAHTDVMSDGVHAGGRRSIPGLSALMDGVEFCASCAAPAALADDEGAMVSSD